MKKYIGYLFVALLIAACSKARIIPENDMVEIVKQIFLSDAIISSTDNNRNLLNRDSIEYYAPIYKKLGYTNAEFDSSIVYYSRNIGIFDQIVDRAIGELSQMETELLAAKSTENIASIIERGIWIGKQNWEITQSNTDESISYFIPAHGPGVYTLTAQILVSDTCNVQQPYSTMSFKLNNSINAYSACNQLKNTALLQTLKLQQVVFDPQITHVYGSLIWYPAAEGQRANQVTVSNITFDFKPVKINECGEELKELRETLLEIKYAPETLSKKCAVTIPYQALAKKALVNDEIKSTGEMAPFTHQKQFPQKPKSSNTKAKKFLD